jgi:hypothetical protein
MQQKDDEQKKKPPIEMTTDEALDYVFGTEIADELRREAGKVEEPETCQPDETE